jgi:hypothetical protein
MPRYTLVWLEMTSDDEESNQANEKTWQEAGFTVNNDGENYEVVAVIEPDPAIGTVLSQAYNIMEQYSHNDPDQVFAIIDEDKNTILTEENLN